MILSDQNGCLNPASVLGIMMISVGIIEILIDIQQLYPYINIAMMLIYGNMSADILIVIGGIAVLSLRNRDYCIRIAVAGVTIGLSFMIRNIFFTNFYGEYASFIVGIVSFLSGVMATVAAISLLCGYSHYATRLSQCLVIMAVVELFTLWQYYQYLTPWSTNLYLNLDSLFYETVYIMMLICLHHESVRVPPVTEKVDTNMGVMADLIHSDQETYITPEDAIKLKLFIEEHTDGCLELTLHNGKDTHNMHIIRRDGRPAHMTVTSESGSNLMNGLRIDLNTATEVHNGVLRVYGNNGVFIQMAVHPMPPKKNLKDTIPILSRIIPSDDSD